MQNIHVAYLAINYRYHLVAKYKIYRFELCSANIFHAHRRGLRNKCIGKSFLLNRHHHSEKYPIKL